MKTNNELICDAGEVEDIPVKKKKKKKIIHHKIMGRQILGKKYYSVS